MPDAQCPLVFCKGSHPLKTDKSGQPFVYCEAARSGVWFRSERAREWLQNGSAVRANPRTIQEQRAASAGFEDEHPSAAPPPDPADELSPFFRKLGLGQTEPGRCLACGAIIPVGETPCSHCGVALDW